MPNYSNDSISTGITGRIRRILAEHARLGMSAQELSEDLNLYDAGMTSHASVNIMVVLEDEFDIEFPDRMLRREVFQSIESIRTAITEVLGMEQVIDSAGRASVPGRPDTL